MGSSNNSTQIFVSQVAISPLVGLAMAQRRLSLGEDEEGGPESPAAAYERLIAALKDIVVGVNNSNCVIINTTKEFMKLFHINILEVPKECRPALRDICNDYTNLMTEVNLLCAERKGVYFGLSYLVTQRITLLAELRKLEDEKEAQLKLAIASNPPVALGTLLEFTEKKIERSEKEMNALTPQLNTSLAKICVEKSFKSILKDIGELRKKMNTFNTLMSQVEKDFSKKNLVVETVETMLGYVVLIACVGLCTGLSPIPTTLACAKSVNDFMTVVKETYLTQEHHNIIIREKDEVVRMLKKMKKTLHALDKEATKLNNNEEELSNIVVTNRKSAKTLLSYFDAIKTGLDNLQTITGLSCEAFEISPAVVTFKHVDLTTVEFIEDYNPDIVKSNFDKMKPAAPPSSTSSSSSNGEANVTESGGGRVKIETEEKEDKEDEEDEEEEEKEDEEDEEDFETIN